MAVDLTVPIPAASSWFVGMIDQAKMQAWISDYLEALRQGVADTGWQNLTGLDSAWTKGTGDLVPQWRQIGSAVFIRGDVSRTSSTLASGLGFTSNLFTVMPASARPSGQWLQRCTVADTNGAVLELRVGTDGGLALRNVGSAALAVGINVGLFTSYPVG